MSPVSVRAGDFHLSLGRGLTLSVQKNESLDIEDTIDGGLFKLATTSFELLLSGGEVTRPLPTFRIAEKDKVYAARMQGNLPYSLRIGANYVWSEVHEMDLRLNEYQAYGGDVSFTAPNDLFDLYCEYAELDSKLSDEEESYNRIPDGSGLYGSLTTSLAGVVVLVEYKDYDHFTYPKDSPYYQYNLPPSADREDEANDHEDIRGFRGEVSYFVPAVGTLLHASHGVFEDHGGNVDLTHTYGGIEYTGDWLYVHGVYGHRYTDETITGEIETTQDRINLDIQVTFAERHSLTLAVETKRKEERFIFGTSLPDQVEVRDENRSFLTYSFSPYLSITAHYAWDYRRGDDFDDLWAGEVEVTPCSHFSAKVLYGAQPGGLVCSGGMCRTVPDFEGVKLETTITF
ncbi:hypothetical protein JW905_00640 [bacterium]|nr:hypothetical protein [candidate division CSSED10-310 bacterium]